MEYVHLSLDHPIYLSGYGKLGGKVVTSYLDTKETIDYEGYLQDFQPLCRMRLELCCKQSIHFI